MRGAMLPLPHMSSWRGVWLSTSTGKSRAERKVERQVKMLTAYGATTV